MIRKFSASYHQLLNSNLRSLAGAEPEQTRFYSTAHYNYSDVTFVNDSFFLNKSFR